MAGIALLSATIVWIVAISYAYAQIQVSPRKPTSPRAVLAAGPGDCFITTREVHPTTNESEWLWIYYIKGELAFNETYICTYIGELTDPLNPYVKDAIENQYYLILFPPEKWDSIPIEDLGEYRLAVYKYGETYYAFGKAKLVDMYIDLFGTPEQLWAIRHSQSIGPAVGASGVSLLGCWIALGAYKLKQPRTMKRLTEVRK